MSRKLMFTNGLGTLTNGAIAPKRSKVEQGGLEEDVDGPTKSIAQVILVDGRSTLNVALKGLK